jgi:hypothetical protein
MATGVFTGAQGGGQRMRRWLENACGRDTEFR